jgi:hypothetical protein
MSQPQGEAVGSDVLDVAVLEFTEDIDPTFFKDAPYIMDGGTVGISKHGDTLLIAGTLKGLSEITEEQIAPTYCLLEFLDDTASATDPAIRRAVAKFEKAEFQVLLGLSGSPVFNTSSNVLCGMVVR